MSPDYGTPAPTGQRPRDSQNLPNKQLTTRRPKCNVLHMNHQHSIQSTTKTAPLPTTLDIFVVWHPHDKIGKQICEKLFNHYHSDAFSGLAGGAIEVYARSVSAPPTHGHPLPIPTPDGTISTNNSFAASPARFAVILIYVERNLIRDSITTDSPWATYLNQILHYSRTEPTRTLILPIFPKQTVDYSNAPLINELANIQGTSDSDIVSVSQPESYYSPADYDKLPRDVSKAIVQKLLRKAPLNDRLEIFVSHARQDIPESDKATINTYGVVSKIASWVKKAQLSSFVDIHDLQPGQEWNKSIRQQAKSSALLMVRTDHYSIREWTQWEVLEAKKAGMPIVFLSALETGESRGSFLLDHVPTVAYRNHSEISEGFSIIKALNRLVDETLKYALWKNQEVYLEQQPHDAETGNSNNRGFDAVSPHPPEPLMLTNFLAEHRKNYPNDNHLWILHPDPPLLPPEHETMIELCALAGYNKNSVHLLTPRLFFAAGGTFGSGEPELQTPNLSLDRPLSDFTLSISASAGEDLNGLGITNRHLESVVAEVAQLTLISGGCISYAGSVGTHTPDLTDSVLQVIKKYIEDAKLDQHRVYGQERYGLTPIHPGTMFNLTVPCTNITSEESLQRLVHLKNDFASTGQICVINEHGNEVALEDAQVWDASSAVRTSNALSRIRSSLHAFTHARLVIGGKTVPKSEQHPNGYLGHIPGIIEETLEALNNQQPVYIAGGFGGAAAVLAYEIGLTDKLPISQHALDAIMNNSTCRNAICRIKELYTATSLYLEADDIEKLTTTQRASELAGLVIKGLVNRNNARDVATSEPHLD